MNSTKMNGFEKQSQSNLRSPTDNSTVTKIAKPESDSLSPKCYLNSQAQII